jgi:hypothetical protein
VLETLKASPEQPAQRLCSRVFPARRLEADTAITGSLCAELDMPGVFVEKTPGYGASDRASGLGTPTIALSIGVDADARRISQALTEPEYLEAWITMPNQAEDSQIVASKGADGYRLDQVRAGCSIASFIGSFLFCHQRKIRLTWRKVAAMEMTESMVDFRIRGNFASSILELRHTGLSSSGEFHWYRQLWGVSLARLATILRSA